MTNRYFPANTPARVPCGICPGSRDGLDAVFCNGSDTGPVSQHPVSYTHLTLPTILRV